MERSDKGISQWLFSCVCTLALIGILLSLFFIIFNVLYRNYRFVKMSSPNINIIIIVGAIMIYACSVMFGLGEPLIKDKLTLEILCKAKPCVLSVGVTLVYGSLCTKTWRVYRIFTHSQATRMVIKDSRLICIIIGLVIIDVIILALWMVLDPPMFKGAKTMDEVPDMIEQNKSPHVRSCESQRNALWIVIVSLTKAAILLYGTHLSWATRNVALIALNDASCIIASVYTCVILASLAALLSPTLMEIPDAWYACVALVLWICATEVLLLQYIPKFRAWKQSPDGNFPLSRSLTSSYLATNPNRSFAQVEEELFLLSAENASLKKALNEKEQFILALKAHVSSATEKLKQFMAEADNSKHDSGCDIDGSSSATSHDGGDPYPIETRVLHENNDDSIHSTRDRMLSDGAVNVSPSRHLLSVSPVDLARQGMKRGRPRDRLSLRSANSLGSQVSIKDITELKRSLVQDLNYAQNLSSNLYKSIAKDLHECRTKPMYFEIAKTEEKLSDVITRTYHIHPDDENASLASSEFTYDNPIFTKGKDGEKHGQDIIVEHASSEGQISRNSSFRSVASLALETHEPRERSHSDEPRSLQYACYTAPGDKPAREGSPSKTVRSTEVTAGQHPKSSLNTYV
ncbi:Gamma-aminobutyric acid type B receptor subunit 2 [Holothuria leucospilota]|uniref:Gamma-aminobutyric acid type B receptor subunit 2 n=1 Tax=Holothuria leucospilota TaxID=206669 RepID=A0A9Q1BZ88_HOLLE|nr:Gamma-aminobutyric acid type B receptor subunit 2 [Holothuria leucospilota]